MSHDPANPGTEAEIFVVDEQPATVDILRLCGSSLSQRHQFLEWEARESDVQGCTNLRNPAPARPSMELSDPAVPILMLLDALRAAGFEARSGPVTHSLGGDAAFDNRRLPTKRNYLKCVLCSSDLFAAGVPTFQSTRSTTWYGYLLRYRRAPPAGLSAKALREQVEGEEEPERPAPLLAPAPMPSAIADGAPAQGQHLVCDDPDIAGDEVPADALVAAGPLAPLPGPALEGDIAGDEPMAVAALPDMLEGVKLHEIAGRYDGQYSYFGRLSVHCNNPDHGRKCRKSRSKMLLVRELGPKAPLCFLGAWLQASNCSEAEHRKYEPSMAEMRAYRETL